jgi:hypothetical protein
MRMLVHTMSISNAEDLSVIQRQRRIPPVREDRVYKSCCYSIDRRLLEFVVQVIIAVGLLTFVGYKLSTPGISCEDASSYWNLLGVLIGWVFKSMASKAA